MSARVGAFAFKERRKKTAVHNGKRLHNHKQGNGEDSQITVRSGLSTLATCTQAMTYFAPNLRGRQVMNNQPKYNTETARN